MSAEFEPCELIEHSDGRLSLIYSEFDDFIDYIEEKGGQGGGYSWESMVTAVMRLRNLELQDLEFDSEGGMFCVVSHNRDNLLQIARIINELGADPALMEKAIADSEAHNEFE